MDKPLTGRDILKQAKSEAGTVTPQEVRELLKSREKVTLVDVREGDEWRSGHLPEAVHVPRGFLEIQAESKIPDKDSSLIVYCAGGNRSPLATKTLKEMGYSDVRYMTTGFSGWRDLGFDLVAPRNWTPSQRDRYSRHFVLPEVGETGQQKISDGKVLVVGAGGLGSPALYYLGAAGVGTLGIVDFDNVEEN
ncbi:MAG: rhodanese-like domain-containing protein, partial [Actinomycetota bacterium]